MNTSKVFQKLDKGWVLLVHSQPRMTLSLKTALRTFGCRNVATLKSFNEGLSAITVRSYSYVFFEARGVLPESVEFVEKAIAESPGSIFIGLCEPADIDQLFRMLKIGVSGFISIPCTAETLEETLIEATKGLDLPDEIKECSERNELFVALVLKQVDAMAESLKATRKNKTSRSGSMGAVCRRALLDAMSLAKRFFAGSRKDLADALSEACIERAKQIDAARPKTRLGKLRKQLAEQRVEKNT